MFPSCNMQCNNNIFSCTIEIPTKGFTPNYYFISYSFNGIYLMFQLNYQQEITNK